MPTDYYRMCRSGSSPIKGPHPPSSCLSLDHWMALVGLELYTFFICMYMTCIFLDCHCWIHSAIAKEVHFTRSYSLQINCGEKGNGALANFKMKCISLPGFSDPLADLNVEAMSSDKESGDSGSQNDLSRILALPTPADFMSPAPSALPKLMTPDAFMTPSASVSI